jgi:hypothetical protein
MYLIPLSQAESVELLIHALRMAGGEADCSSCPAHHVCMKQCLSIADSIERMYASGTLPGASLPAEEEESEAQKEPGKKEKNPATKKPGLKIIK